jgi:hypothetical protein
MATMKMLMIIDAIMPMMMIILQKVIMIRILTMNLGYSYCDDGNDFCGVSCLRVLLKAGVGDFHGFGDTVIAMALVFVMLMLMMINVMLMVTAIVMFVAIIMII